jgi:hypothetical protein
MVRHLATRIGINYTQLIDLTSLFDLSVKTCQRDKMSRGVGSSRVAPWYLQPVVPLDRWHGLRVARKGPLRTRISKKGGLNLSLRL